MHDSFKTAMIALVIFCTACGNGHGPGEDGGTDEVGGVEGVDGADLPDIEADDRAEDPAGEEEEAPPPTRCVIDSIEYDDGTVNPTHPCRICRLSESSSAWTGFNEGAACAPGKVCTGGSCASGCRIDSTFYPAEAQDPLDDSHVCLPSISGTEWTDRVVIAASDSTSDWVAIAAEVCTGTNDELVMGAHLTSGTMVELAPGTFSIAGYLAPEARTRLHGQGDGTVLNFISGTILVRADALELDHFRMTGTLGDPVPVAISISSQTEDLSDIRIHDVNADVAGGNVFEIYANAHDTPNRTLTNITFARCSALDPDGFGFIVGGEGTTPKVENLTFFRCSVRNAGVADTRTNIWVTGIDFAEYAGMTLDKMQAIGCSVDGAWESDYHFEDAPTKTDCVITDCDARNAGRKTGGAVYGAGFLLTSGDVVFSHNTGSGNANGDLRVWDPVEGHYDDYSPPIDIIIPSGSTKVAARIDQGNMSGLEITDGSRKTLVLFSSDGSPVSQEIELGGLFASDDGDVYDFTGTRVLAEFPDYAVMRLVER